jgi:[CysO sulfur-carrier protein]-S-L-cysteine hydrolase
MSDVLRIGHGVFERLVSEARLNPEIECCGLLAGRDGVISTVFPARNALQSAKAYEIAPAELFAIFRRMRAEALEHLGIYHSHPRGENFPSALDIDWAFYPEAAYLIVSPLPAAIRPLRAFRIRNGQAREIDLQIV